MAGLYVEPKLRPCYIIFKCEKIKALFHCWDHVSNVITPSPMVGGHPGGVIAYTTAIVELEDGKIMTNVSPESIQFVDNPFQEYAWEEK